MKFPRLLSILMLCCFSLIAVTQEQASLLSLLTQKEPNHRAATDEVFPDQSPKVVTFFAPGQNGNELPVKRIEFYDDRSIKYEMDLCEVQTGTKAHELWNSTIVPHGVRVDFYSKGNISKISLYKEGLLHGPVKLFHSNGKLKSHLMYEDNEGTGPYQAFDEKGAKKEEGEFIKGKVHGSYTYYYPEGTQAAVIPYLMGKVDGTIEEWHENGALKAKRRMKEGKPNGNGKEPALQLFDKEHNLVESLDFKDGIPEGNLLRFHPNGQESYKISFSKGKKEGFERFYDQEGNLLGKGIYKKGMPVGKHYRNHPNNKLASEAEFDDQGNMVKPAFEYNEKGVKIKEFTFVSQKPFGLLRKWFDDGKAHLESVYDESGNLHGEQKEYYGNGNIKIISYFEHGVRDEIYKEYDKKGTLIQEINFKKW